MQGNTTPQTALLWVTSAWIGMVQTSNSEWNHPIFLQKQLCIFYLFLLHNDTFSHSSTKCWLFPCVQCFPVKVIVTLSCGAASWEQPDQWIVYFYPSSSVQCQSQQRLMYTKASHNTSIMESTQGLSMTLWICRCSQRKFQFFTLGFWIKWLRRFKGKGKPWFYYAFIHRVTHYWNMITGVGAKM